MKFYAAAACALCLARGAAANTLDYFKTSLMVSGPTAQIQRAETYCDRADAIDQLIGLYDDAIKEHQFIGNNPSELFIKIPDGEIQLFQTQRDFLAQDLRAAERRCHAR